MKKEIAVSIQLRPEFYKVSNYTCIEILCEFDTEDLNKNIFIKKITVTPDSYFASILEALLKNETIDSTIKKLDNIADAASLILVLKNIKKCTEAEFINYIEIRLSDVALKLLNSHNIEYLSKDKDYTTFIKANGLLNVKKSIVTDRIPDKMGIISPQYFTINPITELGLLESIYFKDDDTSLYGRIVINESYSDFRIMTLLTTFPKSFVLVPRAVINESKCKLITWDLQPNDKKL